MEIDSGCVHGSADELGYPATDNRVSRADFHATILHLLGLDHQRLSFSP